MWNFGDFHFSVSIASHGNKLLQLVNWDARCADSGIIYSITSSARASTEGGTVRPSAFAVLRLITSSYLVGACTGRSAAFSPLRMRST